MTNLSKLRAAIIEAVPEIMELKFGCRVFIPGEDNFSNRGKRGYGIITHSYVGNEASWSGYDKKQDAISVYLPSSDVYRPCISIKKNKVEILGRPITLADVLRTIDKADVPVELSLYGDMLHIGHYEKPGRNGYYSKAFWELPKNLDDQSPEVWDFLTSVLCTKYNDQ